MSTLVPLGQRTCAACQAGEPTLTAAEINQLLPQVPEWRLVSVGGVQRLRRGFRFADFAGALAFTQRVGALAEQQGHHPLLRTEWGRVRVEWWTHKIHGLHGNDFIMAAKTDALYSSE
jgi:4a-hydroxytetrahydrobiopterin dehydratase